MRALRAAAMALGMIATTTAHADDSGGRDVTVALFSARDVRAVTLTPLNSAAWIADCATCAHRNLSASISFPGYVELFAGGALRITDTASGEHRSAVGLWHLKAVAGSVDVVLTLPSERYVAAVLSAEADAKEPPESLRAMAVVARSYALNSPHYTAPAGHLKADLCDSTECQVARFRSVSDAIEQAVWETAGETLWFGRRSAEVYFSQSCGGMTEDAHAARFATPEVPYLTAHMDPYCVRRSVSTWHTEVKPIDLQSVAKSQGWRLPPEIASVTVTKRSASHRAQMLEFAGSNGVRAQVSASALRLAIDRSLGWNKVRSDWYDIGVRNGTLIFDGRGFGHGVGLCQFGATEMAIEHKNARQILAFYFPGTVVGMGPNDSGWVNEDTAGIKVRSEARLTAEQREEIETSWQEAKTLFPPRTSIAPEISFAPSAELFRQMTSQPGWMLAGTSGSRIVINARPMLHQKTLRHEMLHVLVESEASTKAPLWLREGLVEVLDGEPVGSAMSDAAMEAELSHPTTHGTSEQAHRAAAAKVRAMVAHYGMAPIRSWLVSGVPASVN